MIEIIVKKNLIDNSIFSVSEMEHMCERNNLNRDEMIQKLENCNKSLKGMAYEVHRIEDNEVSDVMMFLLGKNKYRQVREIEDILDELQEVQSMMSRISSDISDIEGEVDSILSNKIEPLVENISKLVDNE